jgi:hypothetical protein
MSMKAIHLALGMLLLAITASAQNNYTGPNNGDWGVAGNWSGGVPTSGQNVVIPNNRAVNVNVNAACNNLTISGGGANSGLNIEDGVTLDVGSALTVNGGNGGSADRTITVGSFSTLECGSLTFGVTGDNSRTITLTTFLSTVNVLGNITMNDNATRHSISISGSTLNLSGSITGGNFTASLLATVNYNGGSAQTIRAASYPYLNFSGGGTKTLGGAVTVTSGSAFTSGVVVSTGANLLSYNDGATVSGASNNSFVAGPVRKTGNETFTFPVGASGTGYHPIIISAPSANTEQFTAEYVRSSATTLGPVTASGVYGVSNCEYWRLNRNVGSTNVNVTIGWTATSGCGSAYVTTLTGLQVASFNGTSWNTSAVNGNSGNTTAGTVTRNAFNAFGNGTSTFSSFALSNVNSNNGSPLPAIYGRVKATSKASGVKIDWEVLTETEVQYYSIDHSTDGVHFNSIHQELPAANDGSRAEYSFLHTTPANGINYYRIKSMEVTGRNHYTIIMKVDTRDGAASITLYPNPVVGNSFSIQASNFVKGQYTINVYSATGQEVYTQAWSHSGGSTTETIQLPSTIRKGMYQLVVSNDENKFMKTFIVQ